MQSKSSGGGSCHSQLYAVMMILHGAWFKKKPANQECDALMN